MNEDNLIGHMGLTWSIKVPKTLQELAEFMEVVAHNVALRQDIEIDRFFIEIASGEDIIRIGANESLKKMDKVIDEWNAGGQKWENQQVTRPQ